tara:strand:- start:1056 stop:1661 length:606 start_codon:yes stop_codon:yes gene_type:complete
MEKILKKYIVEIVKEEKTLISEGLRFHIEENIPISMNVYRPGSEKYFELFIEARKLYKEGKITLEHEIDKMYITEMDTGEWDYYKGELVPLDFPMMMDQDVILEAKYKGRKVKLGVKGATRVKGKKGRAQAYYRDPKTGKVKRVEFGSEMSKAMGKSKKDRDRRKSFGDRHKCSEKKDKSKPGWWSCRLTKMFGRNIPGWW